MASFVDRRVGHPASLLSVTALGLVALTYATWQAAEGRAGFMAAIDSWPGFVRGAVFVACVLTTWGLFTRALLSYQLARYVTDTPRAKIRSAAQGVNKISGTAAATGISATLVSPMRRKACLWYAAHDLGDADDLGENPFVGLAIAIAVPLLGRYLLTGSKCSDEPFLLTEGDEKLVVDPTGAMVVSKRVSLGFGDFEHTIIEGDKLTIYGELRSRHPVEEYCVRSELRDALAALKSNSVELLARFDADGDGKIDEEEWERAREILKGEVEAQRDALSAKPAAHFVHKPRSGSPYIIATFPESDLLKRLYTWSGLNFGAGLVTGSIAILMVS